MITVRPAKLGDVSAIVDLAVESVTRNPLPVRIDRVAMASQARGMISRPSHFVWVAEQDGVVVACVGAYSDQSFWYRGQQCSVMLFWSRVPGAGVALLREFARWVISRPVIKVAVFECEPEIDARTIRFLRRLGFTRESTNLSYVRSSNV